MSDATETVTDNGRDSHELGMFIVWENARAFQDRILADMRSRFEVVRAYEIRWTPAWVTRNFERFYSDLDVRGVYHVLNKGAGPFTAVTLIDRYPSFEGRMTSRGRRTVNARFLDAKLQYRSWTGDLEVHCGETSWETDRDLTMLLGMDARSYVDTIEEHRGTAISRVDRDLTGTRGWASIAELFRVLNHAVNYALLGDGDLPAHGEGKIELITDDYHALHTIVNAEPLLQTAPHGGKFRISVAGRPVEIAIRFVGDQYYDDRWARELLASRALDPGGYYRLSDQNRFEALAYDAIVHTPAFTREIKGALSDMAARLGFDGWTRAVLDDPKTVKKLVDQLLRDRGYDYVQPLDAAAYYNYRLLGFERSKLREKAGAWQRWLHVAARRLISPMIAGYWYARDRMLLRAPWVRRIKRFATSNPFARSAR